MATVIEKDSKTSYEIKLERHRRKVRIIRIAVIAAVLIFAASFILWYFNRDFNSYKVVHSIKRKDSNTVQYIPYGKNLLKYSKDGVSAIDLKGNTIWNGTYEMKEPEASVCEGYVAIADIGGNDIYTVSEKGETNKLEMLYPITQVEVSKQGVIAVLLTEKDVSYIKLYDSTEPGEDPLVELELHVSNDGYPMDIALSNDGKKLVTSFMNIKNGVIQTKLAFFNFSDIGQNYVDKLVGGIPYNKTIIPKLEFIDNNTLCAYGDNKFTIYSMKEKPSKVFEDTFKTEIKSVFSSDSYIGFVVNNYDGTKKYRLIVYSVKGKKVLDKPIDFEYDKVMISGKDIIFQSDLEARILNIKGEQKFDYTFSKTISYFYPVNNFNKYILIDDVKINLIKLVEENK